MDVVVPEEEKEKVDALSMVLYGRPFSELTDEEKAAIYRDYEGERDLANAEYLEASERYKQDMTNGIQAGNVYVASGVGNAAAELINKYRASKDKAAAKERLAELSRDYQVGSRASGEVAAHNRQKMLSELLRQRNAQNSANAAPAPAPTPVPSPAPAPAPTATSQPAQTGQGQTPQANNSLGRRDVGSEMAMRMRGNTTMPSMATPPIVPQQSGPVFTQEDLRKRKRDEMVAMLRGY